MRGDKEFLRVLEAIINCTVLGGWRGKGSRDHSGAYFTIRGIEVFIDHIAGIS